MSSAQARQNHTKDVRTHGKNLSNVEAIPDPKPNHTALRVYLENHPADGSRTAFGMQEGVLREWVDVRRARNEEYPETVKRCSGRPRHWFCAVRREIEGRKGKKKRKKRLVNSPYRHPRRLLLTETSSPCLLRGVCGPPLPRVRHARTRLLP